MTNVMICSEKKLNTTGFDDDSWMQKIQNGDA